MHKILEQTTYHAVYDDSILDAMKFAHVNGFVGIQIAVESPHLAFEQLTDYQCSQIADYRQDHGLLISLHAPDDACSLFTYSPLLNEGIFRYFAALFDFADRIGAHLVTVHLGNATTFPTATMPRQPMPSVDSVLYQQALKSNLQRLTELAEHQVPVCLEAYGLSVESMQTIQPFVQAGNLHLCWDLAKTFDRDGNPITPLMHFFRRNMDAIRHVHLHDRNTVAGHQVIGDGRIDFAPLLANLIDADVREYCIEVRPREKALESLARLKELLQA